MPKVTFDMQNVVGISIRGEVGDPSVLPDDGGLIGRFLQWQADNQVVPAVAGTASGHGTFVGFFDPEDAKIVKAWLLQQGATQDD